MYEFNEDQNKQFRDLAGKMRFVGSFSTAFGLLSLLICLFVVGFLYNDRLPKGFREKATEYAKKAQESLPEDLKKQASEYALDKIPTNNSFLTGVAIFSGVTGLLFLLQGVWTRSSAHSFQLIVDTKGSDITNLMNAVSALQSMYGQVYMLLMLGLLGGLIGVGLTIYHYFGG